jgi:DNA-binding NarL/FixJ family response regulator
VTHSDPTPTANRLRLLIADDHPVFRRGLRALLGTIPDFEIVGEATTGAEAVARAAELQPDVILMDLQMPEGSGILATREVLHANPGVRVLIVTLFQDDDSVFMALRAGARGYVLKDAEEEEMIRAIRAVGAGEAIFSPGVAGRVLAYLGADRRSAPEKVFPTLTEREREILALIARGRTNPAIARELSLSPKTIANHVSNIFGKLQIADRAEAIILAREAGLGR